jgi:acyl-[acyl-carrier-protein]-phospholipid O-acyltransferase/long-chain-fatty-acid--[acyl-carrier-protein] ligase
MAEPSARQSPESRGWISFWWLNGAQFFGALNDNVFKLLLIFFVIADRGVEAAPTVGAVATALLAVPFLAFSATAGVLADRYSKRAVVVWAKVAEVAIMALGVGAFALGREWMLYVVMFLMATQSAFFGPAKYGIVPELVGRERLSRANGILQALTYLAVIGGTVIAPYLSTATRGNYVVCGLVCVLIAGLGAAAGLPIQRTPPAGSTRRVSWLFVREVWRTLWSVRHDGYLLAALLASGYFMMLAAYMQFNVIPYAMEEMNLPKEQGSYLFLFGAFGIGIGSLLAGRLSGRNVELGVVPLGAAGLTLTSLAVGCGGLSLPGLRLLVWLMGLSAGLFVVPVEAWIQFRSPSARRGEIIATGGFLSWCGVVLCAGLIYLFGAVLELSARQGFFVLGLLTLVLTVVTVWLLPDFLLRFVGVVVTRCAYRLRILGRDRVPIEGPALLVCNHVSWMDALLLLATQQRRIRFLAERGTWEQPWLRPLMRLMGIIPVSTADGPKKVVASLRAAREALDAGYLVCIFAEGALTRSGNLLAFRSGFEHIVKGTDYPILPVYLGGAWGSIFSYAHGTPLRRLPVSFPYPVTIVFGDPMPATSSAADVRERILELSCRYFEDRKRQRRPLFAEFARTARHNWFGEAMADSAGRRLTYAQALTAALALARALKPRVAGQTYVGVLLPPSIGGALANLALSALGKAPVNLNFTASEAAFRSAIRQADIRCVVASRAFLEKLGGKVQPPEGTVCLEDLMAGIGAGAKALAWLRAGLLPSGWLGRIKGFEPDRVAAVLFSSGSTAEPKGVRLSHHNLASNIEALRMVFHPSDRDAVCAALPFFHSFGFTATLWFPLLSGFRAVYHPSPLDAKGVAEVVRGHGATLLFATPTFLTAYLRRAEPDDFRTLRLVVAGAEKLRPALADAFAEKFGIRPLEGYGATELAPVAALNVPDVELGGIRQVGAKPGTVGHPLPGVAVRIVDPATGQAVRQGQDGLLLVKGPNVMLGYLGQPAKTAEVLRDGWYNTGDIAHEDRDGFLAITDRLSRFSKIAGEMVPHVAVEDELQRRLGRTLQSLAVTSVADAKRGERLVVLYTDEAGGAADLRRAVAASELPNLWKPDAASLFRVDALPLLGSGKLDLKGLRERATQLTAPPPETDPEKLA